MTTAAHNTEHASAVVRRAMGDLVAGLVPLAAVALATRWMVSLPSVYLWQTLAHYGAMAALVAGFASPTLPGPGLGPANRVTLARATLILPITALVWTPSALSETALWWTITVATVAMMLDGVDGWVARRTRSHTPFGARFDMELDAFLLLALSVLVWQSGKVDAWVLLIGALRYLFVAAGAVWPALRGELPPAARRKAICVVQGVVLLVCLGPIIPAWLAVASAAGALVSLVYSFSVDTWWLFSSRRHDAV